MKLTAEMIEKGRSLNGGWSMAQTNLLGVKWPLVNGWKKAIEGAEITQGNFRAFLALKDRHLTSTNLETLATKLLKKKARKRSQPAPDPVIVERAGRIVKTAFGSNATTCTANACTYPKCLCGTAE